MNTTGGPKSPYDWKPDEYKEILAGGTRLQISKQKKIAVIGAGMSGLVAASLLKRTGHDVEIFEAKHMVGGRVKTLRDRFTTGFHAEAGAMRVPSHHALTMWLIKDIFNLDTIKFVNDAGGGLIYINEKRSTYDAYRAAPAFFNVIFNEEKQSIKLTPEEQGTTAWDIFEICLQNHIRKHQNPEFEIEMLQGKAVDPNTNRSRLLPQDQLDLLTMDFDKYSLRQFLTDEAEFSGKRLTPSARNMIYGVLSHEMQMSSSMAAVVAQYIAMNAREYKQIKEGMDQLPRAFLNSKSSRFPALEEDIRYNTRVIEVVDEPPGLLVRSRNTITAHESEGKFDRVILCIPFSALRHIQMKNLTSAPKRRAVRQLHYANACKILLEFSHKFWQDTMTEDRPAIMGGHSVTDLAIRHIYYPSPRQNENEYGRGLLLASYTWGDDSLRWTSLKPDDRVRFALRDLERVHDLSEGRLASSCIGGVSHSWAEDEFTSGAFTHCEPDQIRDLFPFVWRPENGIHYAGEHTSTKHGWIEGAVESGIRVAKELCDVMESSA